VTSTKRVFLAACLRAIDDYGIWKCILHVLAVGIHSRSASYVVQSTMKMELVLSSVTEHKPHY
jgi:hypothetical protein